MMIIVSKCINQKGYKPCKKRQEERKARVKEQLEIGFDDKIQKAMDKKDAVHATDMQGLLVEVEAPKKTSEDDVRAAAIANM